MPDPFLTDDDVRLFAEGRHFRAYDKLGAHPVRVDDVDGVYFAVVAPNAAAVSVIGDFNGWSPSADPMAKVERTGIWTRFVPGIGAGALYKFHLVSAAGEALADKADPFAFAAELRPRSASLVWDLAAYAWQDQAWMRDRAGRHGHEAPIAIYEVHLGSWRRAQEAGGRWLTYTELGSKLAAYVEEMGFTHVELLPVSEHPLDDSWGYQVVGYYAPTSRYGTPDDFRAFIDTLHQAGLGVILDWVPGHFPRDGHGLSRFDGSCLYEYADPREGLHLEWGTQLFDYGRGEVRNFLISNARFWLEQYHIDGLRIDAVASMLYRDYSRGRGEWIPNVRGGNENLEAIDLLRQLNTTIYGEFPDVLMFAEESTAWPRVTAPVHLHGLGFGFKWNMGWMHDTLDFFARDPEHRPWHVESLCASLRHAFSENFVLPLSHDEVVHGKGSIIDRMSGDPWQRFASARLLYGYLFGHPGKKLLFMGNEFGQIREWAFGRGLDWQLLERPAHAGLQRWVRDLNHCYRSDPRLHRLDGSDGGFEWVDSRGPAAAVVSFLRRGGVANDPVLFVCNFTLADRPGERVGVPCDGPWAVLLNSDAARYGGRDGGPQGVLRAESVPIQGRPYSIQFALPALSLLVFGCAAGGTDPKDSPQAGHCRASECSREQ